jgi:hypothetical protein
VGQREKIEGKEETSHKEEQEKSWKKRKRGRWMEWVDDL